MAFIEVSNRYLEQNQQSQVDKNYSTTNYPTLEDLLLYWMGKKSLDSLEVTREMAEEMLKVSALRKWYEMGPAGPARFLSEVEDPRQWLRERRDSWDGIWIEHAKMAHARQSMELLMAPGDHRRLRFPAGWDPDTLPETEESAWVATLTTEEQIVVYGHPMIMAAALRRPVWALVDSEGQLWGMEMTGRLAPHPVDSDLRILAWGAWRNRALFRLWDLPGEGL